LYILVYVILKHKIITLSKIIGIDPGTTTIGFALWESSLATRHFTLVDYGVITTPPWLLSQKLHCLKQDLESLLDLHKPDVLWIERLFFYKNITTAIDVAHARGIILECAYARGIALVEFTPLEVKKAITGNGRAPKKQVQAATAKILWLNEISGPDDAADALAIAYITHIHSFRNRTLKV
jgi:crossover junction endodeoxyribonuclease RuvC